VVEHEVDEAAFERDEGRDSPAPAEIYFRPKHPVQHSKSGAVDKDVAGGRVGEAFRERLIIILVKLAFEIHVPDCGNTNPGTQAGKVGFGLPQPEIVGIEADL